MSLRQVKVSSFVSLQKALYFNCLYSLIFGASLIAQCIYKMSYLMISAPARAFVPALTVTWCAVEILRLYVGSTGNLNESVSSLCAFWVLTLLVSSPIVIFLSFVASPTGTALPLDIAVGIPQVIFIAVELWIGWAAILAFIKKQTLEFYQLVASDRAQRAAAAVAPRGATRVRRRAGGGAASVGTLSPGDDRSSIGSRSGSPTSAMGSVGLADIAREGLTGLRNLARGAPASSDTSNLSRRFALAGSGAARER